MWDIDFLKVTSATHKIQMNSQKNQVLEGKSIWGRDDNTWANSTGHASLSMKWGSFVLFLFLFCGCEIHWTGMLQIVFLTCLESSRWGGGVHGLWFHDIWTCTCGAKVLEYWMISSLKIKLNHSWKFWRNWYVPLVLLEWSWWARFNGIYLVRFGFRILILSDF